MHGKCSKVLLYEEQVKREHTIELALFLVEASHK